MPSSPALPPDIYTIPAGSDFARDLATGIFRKFASEDDPGALARVSVLVPTRRAVSALQEAFEHLAPGGSLLLPVIRPIGDVDEEGLVFEPGYLERALTGEAELPAAISSLKRQLILARLIRHWVGASGAASAPHTMSEAQALAYSSDLAAFLDNVDREEVSLEGLGELVPEALALHWQKVLTFLEILTASWPEILAEQNLMNPAARRSQLIRRLAEAWQKSPPEGPVIVAGSTGSIPATAALMKAVRQLPQGYLVLPGLDLTLEEAAWSQLEESHPQFGLKHLLGALTTRREEVQVWPHSAPFEASRTRYDILSEAMRPAETTERWQGSPLKDLGEEALGAAFEGFHVIEARDPGEEARVLALVMRETLEEQGKTVALVTPDRQIARRTANELMRWNIEVDDSAGQPLSSTPQGSLLEAIWTAVGEGFSPTSLLALLKHPLVALGRTRVSLRADAAKLEMLSLRGPRPEAGIEALEALVQSKKESADKAASLAILEELRRAFAPLLGLLAEETLDPAKVFEELARTAEALAATEAHAGSERLWAGDAGEAMHAFVVELLEEGAALDVDRAADFPPMFRELMRGRVVRPHFGLHPRCFIWGPLEARLQSADVILLAGLNEKTWPQEVKPDPWLSRPMAKALGLPTPERRIGQSAHDFMQLATAPKVFLTRAESEDGAPTVPSRWLMRLKNMCAGFGWEEVLNSRTPYLEWARQFDQPTDYRPCKEPLPRPPVAARPRQSSVTDIERWIRDPYGFYAKKVLGLRPLDPLEADGDARDRGTIIHTVLERFLEQHGNEMPEDAREQLEALGEEVFDELQASPEIRLFWGPRFKEIAAWFVERERARADVKPLALEAEGRLTFAAPAGPFELTAVADRIDAFDDGTLGLYDYKTGRVPSEPMVASGLAPQLTLEAWILAEGGFEGVPAAELKELAFVGLSGGEPAGVVRPIRKERGSAITKAEEGLKARVALFDEEATPYPSRVRPMFDHVEEPYDHLARVKEWSVVGGDSE